MRFACPGKEKAEDMKMVEVAPPAQRMMEMIAGYWITQIVHGAAVAGYADHLHEGSATAEALSARARMEPAAVLRHLRACASLGLVTFNGETFATTPLLDTLRREHPQSMRGFALSQPAPGHWQPWGRFIDALRTGTHQTEATLGAGIFDYYKHHPAEADAFTEAMEGLTMVLAREAAQVIDTGGISRVVDVGGASGALLAPLLEANPELKGTLFDLPNVIEGQAFTNIPAPIRNRMDKVGGDFFQSVPEADLYLLKFILHDWDDDECVAILRNCRKAIAPGGRIAIIELVLGEIGDPGFAPLMDLNMLVMTGGRERSFAEYAALLARAGFGEAALTPTVTAMSAITATAVD